MSDISYLKTSLTFEHSNPLKSSPGSHSQSVSGSMGIMSSWCFRFRSALCHCIYVASASRYLSRTRICARLLTVATQSSHLNCRSQLVWQQCTCHNYCACDKWGHRPKDKQMQKM